MANLEQQLLDACRRSGKSMKRIADESGLCYASVHNFMASGRSLTLATASRLCEALGLELRPMRRRKRKGGK